MLEWVRRGRKWCQKESKGVSFRCMLSYVAMVHILCKVKKSGIYCNCSKNSEEHVFYFCFVLKNGLLQIFWHVRASLTTVILYFLNQIENRNIKKPSTTVPSIHKKTASFFWFCLLLYPTAKIKQVLPILSHFLSHMYILDNVYFIFVSSVHEPILPTMPPPLLYQPMTVS